MSFLQAFSSKNEPFVAEFMYIYLLIESQSSNVGVCSSHSRIQLNLKALSEHLPLLLSSQVDAPPESLRQNHSSMVTRTMQ